MIKYFIACLMLFFSISAQAQSTQEVLIFSKDHCPYCEQLKTDLDTTIRAANPQVTFTVLNIKDDAVVDRLRQLARQHKMLSVGLPLIFVGDTYIMGWDTENAAKLQSLLK